MTALHLSSSPYTLLIEERGAKLWNPEGRFLVSLPDVPAGLPKRREWGEVLKEHLPAKAKVQLLLTQSNLDIQCQEVPYLSAKEQRDVSGRIASAQAAGETYNAAHALDRDPNADGGHQLWVVSHPALDMQEWVAALSFAGAELVFATPWQRAFLAALDQDSPAGLFLALESGTGRLIFFKGRSLVLMRTFRLPEDIDLEDPRDDGAELLLELVAEETARTVQFIKQKHRGIAFEELQIVGLPEIPTALVERLGRGLHLAVKGLAPLLSAFLLRGMQREKGRKDGLNLVPLEIQEALKLRLLRLSVWIAAAVMLALLGAAQIYLSSSESNYRSALRQAETARDQRKTLAQEAAKASRLRFGLLRLRCAEQRQSASLEHLEALGLALFEVPSGLVLEKVEIAQAPGDPLSHRFTVEGTALTRKRFSAGPLAVYLARLHAFPDMHLDPLQDISVSDRASVDKSLTPEQAIIRFKLTGVAP